ncbi:aspartyl-phosphate phosphatase Spo0E family protein [Sporolituus thermophilus]|uniref:Spo0E like sporulation regulatory protein n=1 Tax=Sporolituus thermophilus DSM 23256 TaxID=1123285 RepID=A0A1G7JV07_9FIRM|nr:aspartyl-phosphate phosphatase Spo0E family protein [Sporolituus thermophilus]SDF28624.1 Spo0E like sporulation regulatory protein [Sporolituus thermophilus DSM 23256]
MQKGLGQMAQSIETMRRQLYYVADLKGRTSAEVLALSQQLDKLLAKYERLKLALRA